MGYYTLHRIRIINKYNTKKNFEILGEYIRKISGYIFHIYGSVLKDYSDKESDEGNKWYDYEDDMKEVSRLFPHFEIQLKGKGEEGEICEKIYKDGYSYFNNPSVFSDPDPGFVSDSKNGSEYESKSGSEYDSNSDSEEEIFIEINKQKYQIKEILTIFIRFKDF